MTDMRFMVQVGNSTTPLARDQCVNTFYLRQTGVPLGTDWDDLCADAAELWATYRGYPNSENLVTVTAYDMADAKPRIPKSVRTHAIAGIAGGGPREVAACLSYYAGVNRPRKRGRMYIGPWQQSVMSQTFGDGSSLAALANGIANLGGIDVDWVQHSQVDNTFNTVTDWWVDNEWDTMRSRGLKATTRLTGTVDE